MCGILGHAVVRGDDPATAALAVPPGIRLDALLDRGPDAVGALDVDGVSLRHTRLAVIDAAETSNQPLRSGALALVCNGEIWNHRALRAAARDYVHSTTSDCEAVLQVYAEDGVAGFARLDGFYSFILHDARNRRLIAHRDPVGKKPLFHARVGQAHWFASNATAIRQNARSPAAPFAPRTEQVAFYLTHGFTHPATGFFDGIEPVLPGETLVIDLDTGHVTRTRTELRPPEALAFPLTAEGVLAEFERRLSAAVEKRLAGLRTPVLIFSGGLDSTLLAVEMLKRAPQTELLTMRQPLPFLHDEPFARYAARKLGARLHFTTPWRQLGRRADEAIARLDQPLALPSYFLLSALAQDAQVFGNVLFTGDGADEVCFGYRPPSAWFARAPSEAAPTWLSGPQPASPFSDWGYVQGQLDLIGHAFVKVDKATAENRMEARVPFLDHDLIRLFREIPGDFWRGPLDVSKQPIRAALRARGFPGWFIERPRRGFTFPFRYLLAPELGALRDRLAASRDALEAVGVRPGPLPTRLELFRGFDRYWRLIVLGTFLGRLGG
jgi:asparagine synthase (glutamine-hydrolysing)